MPFAARMRCTKWRQRIAAATVMRNRQRLRAALLPESLNTGTWIIPEKDDPDSVAGVLVRADVDPDHWLGAGVASTLNVLIRGSDIYTPITIDNGINVARFQGADELLASGYIWEENRKQLAYKPFVVAQPNGVAT